MGTNPTPTMVEVTERTHAVILGPEETLCCFIITDEEPTIVDAATATALDDIVSALHALGVDPKNLGHVVVSHVHLDHSGAAAGLVDWADDATVYIHESTARHLIDPTRLIESTKEVLGDEVYHMGAPGSVPAEAIQQVAADGATIDTGDRTLQVIPTPGHSPDHLAVHDDNDELTFANEAIGRYYPRADCWVPPITMPRFDIDAVATSIETIDRLDPSIIGLSHVGTVAAEEALDRAANRLDEFATAIPAWYESTGSIEATVERVRVDLLDLDGAYPERVVETQAEICTYGVLDDFDLL